MAQLLNNSDALEAQQRLDDLAREPTEDDSWKVFQNIQLAALPAESLPKAPETKSKAREVQPEKPKVDVAVAGNDTASEDHQAVRDEEDDVWRVFQQMPKGPIPPWSRL
jgi:hypothetical protein